MSNQNTFHCIVDDTALITNLDEIEPWVQAGTVNLVVPLYTLERLHLLKKDASQLGQSARKALKFLDQTADLSHSPVVIQGLEDQYTKWADVESHYAESIIRRDESENMVPVEDVNTSNAAGEIVKEESSPEKLLKDLSLSSDDFKTSPISTPPLSPVISEPQSNKTSPEVPSAKLAKHDATPVPPTLKSLINYVVWYTYEGQKGAADKNLIFLTNSADAAQIAKDFSVVPKTIHQLRASISTEFEQPERMTSAQHKKKSSTRALSFKDEAEPRTLFRYDEGSSEDEELVFKPRTKELSRPGSSGRGGPNNSVRSRGAVHSPSNSVNAATAPKPQVPVEEIDPDSFDRGTFARGSTPLANVGNHYGPFSNTHNRGGQRNFSSPMPRGGGGYRGNTFRGRGRGRLFVP
ncbi:hypothetical protein LTR24_010542 [Lithohypha guttulata]|uniref:PIN domain-containing protein n=1 Tax=Lithohypha guttulata TaxID=1690604 RepID=A0ABR0JUC9_9EURO|nr:hypothetical protein LTR24_010542 [Lithohypha guttulata]